jgi:hypothetical protein
VTLHAPRSVRDFEGMNPHTPKGVSTLGVGVLIDSEFLEGDFRGKKSMD